MAPLIDNPFSWIYFPTALMLGALHALEPGHAKTLTAAYLIGIKGTKRDAFFLGLSVAFTHSLVVIGISVGALWLGRETFTKDITHWLQIGSGLVVVMLGIWMLVRRLGHLRKKQSHHHGAPNPVQVKSVLTEGILEIVQTENGERMKYTSLQSGVKLELQVVINRQGVNEILRLTQSIQNPNEYFSEDAPNEPHEFSAELEVKLGREKDMMLFKMHEPEDHHDHSHMNDDEHARVHAAAIPEYAKRGERPTMGQILAFGAAGGMIPCPASITVMLLALSIGQFASGLLAVAGFSLGLAITLVGIGLIVVEGISRLHGAGRFHWVSTQAPILSAIVVILSGLGALAFAR